MKPYYQSSQLECLGTNPALQAIPASPLVPPDTDLRDFPCVPIDVRELRDPRFSSEISAEGFRAAVLLLCAAWHQVPAASLPDNDANLSNLAGYGRFVGEFQKIKEEALYGFVRCADGRWYHPGLAVQAMSARTAVGRENSP